MAKAKKDQTLETLETIVPDQITPIEPIVSEVVTETIVPEIKEQVKPVIKPKDEIVEIPQKAPLTNSQKRIMSHQAVKNY